MVSEDTSESKKLFQGLSRVWAEAKTMETDTTDVSGVGGKCSSEPDLAIRPKEASQTA